MLEHGLKEMDKTKLWCHLHQVTNQVKPGYEVRFKEFSGQATN